jgi:hypothetical protein
MVEGKRKAFNIMIGQMSIDSEELIKKECNNYDTDVIEDGITKYKIKYDILALIEAYRVTHRPKNYGDAEDVMYQVENEFSNFKMNELSLTEFDLIFDSHLKNMKAVGCNIPEEKMLARIYKGKLNESRYADFIDELNKSTVFGTTKFPESVNKVKELLSKFKGGSTTAMKSTHATVAVTDPNAKSGILDKSNECFKFAKGECTRGDKCKYAHSTTNIISTTCDLCGMQGHVVSKCNKLQQARELIKESQVATLSEISPEESRTFMVTTSEHDMCIILDTGAEASVFRDEELLTDVHDSSHTHEYSGFDGSKLSSTRVGTFLDMKIPVCQEVSANILSFSNLRDRNIDIIYNEADDSFTLNFNGNYMVFSREKKAVRT